MKILISVDDSQGRLLLNEILMIKEIDKSIVVIDDDNRHNNIQELIEVLSDQCGIGPRPIDQELNILITRPPEFVYPQVIETTLAFERKKEREQWKHRQKHYRK